TNGKRAESYVACQAQNDDAGADGAGNGGLRRRAAHATDGGGTTGSSREIVSRRQEGRHGRRGKGDAHSKDPRGEVIYGVGQAKGRGAHRHPTDKGGRWQEGRGATVRRAGKRRQG